MQGTRVAITVEEETVEGTVEMVSYTLRGGDAVYTVALDSPLADGRERVLVGADELQR